MVKCPNCGATVEGNQVYCSNCNAKFPTELQSKIKAEQEGGAVSPSNNDNEHHTSKMNFCYKCGAKITEGHKFCPSCGISIENVNSKSTTSTITNTKPVLESNENKSTQTSTTLQRKVNVKGGRYSGRKWFLKIPYKIYETDVDFSDKSVILAQGSGFATAGSKHPTEIEYKAIYGVEAKKKYSVSNVILSCFAVLGAIVTHVWAALLVALLAFWIGKTAVVSIRYSNGIYTIPTEFMSDAEELRDKINTAMRQSNT